MHRTHVTDPDGAHLLSTAVGTDPTLETSESPDGHLLLVGEATLVPCVAPGLVVVVVVLALPVARVAPEATEGSGAAEAVVVAQSGAGAAESLTHDVAAVGVVVADVAVVGEGFSK